VAHIVSVYFYGVFMHNFAKIPKWTGNLLGLSPQIISTKFGQDAKKTLNYKLTNGHTDIRHKDNDRNLLIQQFHSSLVTAELKQQTNSLTWVVFEGRERKVLPRTGCLVAQ